MDRPIPQFPSKGFGVECVVRRDCHLSEARTVTVPVGSSRLETHAKTEGCAAISALDHWTFVTI